MQFVVVAEVQLHNAIGKHKHKIESRRSRKRKIRRIDTKDEDLSRFFRVLSCNSVTFRSHCNSIALVITISENRINWRAWIMSFNYNIMQTKVKLEFRNKCSNTYDRRYIHVEQLFNLLNLMKNNFIFLSGDSFDLKVVWRKCSEDVIGSPVYSFLITMHLIWEKFNEITRI